MRDMLCLVIFMVSLSACGIKGALYLPEQRYPQKNIPAAPANDANTSNSSVTQPINTETK